MPSGSFPCNTRCRWEVAALRISLVCACLMLMLLASDFMHFSGRRSPTGEDRRGAVVSSGSNESAATLNQLRLQRFALCDKMQRAVFRRPRSNTSIYFVGDSTALQTFRATVATATRCMWMFARRRGDAGWLEAAEKLIATNRELLRLITRRVTQTSPVMRIVGWHDPGTSSTMTFHFVRALYAVHAGAVVSRLARELCPSVDVVISVHVGTWDLLRPEHSTNGYALDQDYARNMTLWQETLRNWAAVYRRMFVAPVDAAAQQCRGAVIVNAVARPNCSARKFSRVAEMSSGNTADGGAVGTIISPQPLDPYRFVQRASCRRLVVSGSWKSMHTVTLSSFVHATVRDADALVWLQHACSMSDGAHIDAEEDELKDVTDPRTDVAPRACRLFSQLSLWNMVSLS